MNTYPRESISWPDREPWLELDFPVAEFESRLSRFWDDVGSSVNTLIVYGDAGDHSDLRYLTGLSLWWGSAIAVFSPEHDAILVVGGASHGEPMHSNVQTTWVRDLRASFESEPSDLLALVKSTEAGPVIALPDLARKPHGLIEAITAKWPTAVVRPNTSTLAQLRAIKSPAEIDVIRRLGKVTSDAMSVAVGAAVAGATESEIAAAAHQACVVAGAERMLFGCFVVAGQRSFLKNVSPRPEKVIHAQELVFIDLGCRLHGYQSDMSRNVVPGGARGQLRDMLDACLEAQESAIRLVRPGVVAWDLVRAMNETFATRGFGDWDWSLCHSFGLDLNEGLRFSPTSSDELEQGMCFYIEPMIIPRTVGCICLEDMFVVTASGGEEVTSSLKKHW